MLNRSYYVYYMHVDHIIMGPSYKVDYVFHLIDIGMRFLKKRLPWCQVLLAKFRPLVSFKKSLSWFKMSWF
jgi:hypothetical protein